MSNIDKQALRVAAEKAKHAGEAPVMSFDQRISALQDFLCKANPATVLRLLNELEEVKELFLGAKALMYQSGGTPIENSLNPIDAWLYDAERAAAAAEGE